MKEFTLFGIFTQLAMGLALLICCIKGLFMAWAQGIIMFLMCLFFPPLATASGLFHFVAGIDIPKAIMVEFRGQQTTTPVMNPHR